MAKKTCSLKFDPNFRDDKPGRHCVGSSNDGEWDFFVDFKPNNNDIIDYYPAQCMSASIAQSPHPNSSKCFLWNHTLQLKVQLPRFLFTPKRLLKGLVRCYTAPIGRKGKKERCVYKVYFFYLYHPGYIWCSDDTRNWQGEYCLDPQITQFYEDVVLFEPDNLCGISKFGLLCRGNMRIQSPNYSVLYQRRLVLLHENRRDRLLLVERRSLCSWEVWEIDFANRCWVRVSNLEGIILFVNRLKTAAYSHPGLKGNCICFTEYVQDLENFYVLWLADRSVSVFKNQPHSGFPAWFPNLGNPSMPWLSFVEEDEVKNTVAEEHNEGDIDISPFCSDKIYSLANGFRELPYDLQRAITQDFDAMDYTNFRLVCTEWRKIAPPIKWKPYISSSPLEYPWLMLCHEDQQFLSIIDPTCNMRFYYNNEDLSRCKIRYSKDGWLLVTHGERIFFLEPFSKAKIQLPNLPKDSKIDTMSFSSSPVCSGWVIISILSALYTYQVMYLRSVDKQWNIIDCPSAPQITFFACGSSPVFHDRAFYYLDHIGNLATLWWDNAVEAFRSRIITIGGPHEPLTNFSRGHLISCEDDLYLVVAGCFGKFVRMYKLDFESLEWKRTQIMKNYSFFISQTSSFAVPVTKKTQEKAVYFSLFIDDRLLFYKSNASEFSCLDDDNSIRSNGGRGFYERKELPYGIWIQPKVIRGYRY